MCKHLISLVKQALNTNSRITKYVLVLFTMIIFYPVSGWSEIITLNPTQDTYVYINFPTTSYGSNTLLQTTSNQQFKREALLQFDLSGIPQGAQIVSAHLELYSDSIPKTDTATRVYANSSSWSETTTWNTKPSRALSPNFEDKHLSKSYQVF